MTKVYVWIYENGAKELELDPYHAFAKLLGRASKPCKLEKIEKGGQWKEDKRVEEEKMTDFAFNFYIVTFQDSFWREEKRPFRARFPFFGAIFVNPDISINAKSCSGGLILKLCFNMYSL